MELLAPRSKTHFLSKIRARARIVWRDHRVVVRQAPFLAILFRRQAIVGAQVALQRFEFLAVFQANNVIGHDRFFYRNLGLAIFALDRREAPRCPAQGGMGVGDQGWKLGRRDRIVADVSCNDRGRDVYKLWR